MLHDFQALSISFSLTDQKESFRWEASVSYFGCCRLMKNAHQNKVLPKLFPAESIRPRFLKCSGPVTDVSLIHLPPAMLMPSEDHKSLLKE